MDWTRSVNIYCERLDESFWSEPVNAITNGAFFVAAWLAWRAAKARGRLDWTMWLLIALTTAVGVGSTLWHTFAQAWAGAADVIPILLFILSYFGLAMWRYFGMGRAEAVAMMVGFFFFANGLRATAGATLPAPLQPAVGYLPALTALAVCGALLALRRLPTAPWLLAAAATFTLSLTFRALDQQYCDAFPMGTHFMWHILNGAVLAILMFGWMRHGARPTGDAPVATPVAPPVAPPVAADAASR